MLRSPPSNPDGNNDDGNEAARRLASLDVVRPLCKISSVASADQGSMAALAALAVLCSHDRVGNRCVEDFLEARGVGRMLEIALSSPPDDDFSSTSWSTWRRQVNYACALLANATRTERGAVDFIGMAFPEEAVFSSSNEGNRENGAWKKRDAKPTAALLLSRFLNPAFVDESSPSYRSRGRTSDDGEHDSDLEEESSEKRPQSSDPDLRPQTLEPMGEEHYDPYQHVAAVLMNITQLETGRDFLMKFTYIRKPNDGENKTLNDESSTSHLQSILPQLTSTNVHRRRGVAGTIKNCCFSQDSVWWLLHMVRVDKHLLMTLAGPEELDVDEKIGLDPDYWLLGPQKVREPDSLVRLYVVEALLLLLASGRRARETLRERRTYVVIKLADMVEENEEVGERMLECVQYLRRDEEGEDEGSSDRRAYESYAKGMLAANYAKNEGCRRTALPTSSSGALVEEKEWDGEDYDDVD